MTRPATGPGRTMLDKIWVRHAVAEGPGGRTPLYVDRHLVHEGSSHAFARLRAAGRRVRRPDLTVATADHYVPTTAAGAATADPEVRTKVAELDRNTGAWGIRSFGPGDARQGIVHVIGPEQGLTQPGLLLVCGDSHTSTHGALGALAFGIGASEVEHVLATQTLWQRRPRVMRVRAEGRLGFGVAAKDLVLHLIATIGAGGGTGHVLEFAGPAIASLSIEGRLTLCNMAIEAGSRAGMVAPDETTCAYLEGRPEAPRGDAWARALACMGPAPGTPLAGIRVGRVFIGSCTNSRLEDLRAAAAVVRGRRAVVPAMAVPGSGRVKRGAETEGLDRIFREAGFEWRDPGCSMCAAMNGDTAAPGERVVRILVAAENFGCGSSRKGAVWALAGRGFRAVIAPSFGDIFFENCGKNGFPAAVLPGPAVAALRSALRAFPGARVAIDLPAQTVRGPDGAVHRFEIDPFRKHCLLEGLDEIGLTLAHEAAIAAFEARRVAERPWLSPAGGNQSGGGASR